MDFINDVLNYENEKIIFSFAVLFVVFVLRKIMISLAKKVAENNNYIHKRKQDIIKITNILSFLVFVILEFSVWGVHHKDLVIFVSSVFTVIGVAFVAQWSILSNITSGLVMFFAGVIKCGDSIRILDKDNPIKGTVENVGIFYTRILSEERQYLIPNSQLIQKVIVTGNVKDLENEKESDA